MSERKEPGLNLSGLDGDAVDQRPPQKPRPHAPQASGSNNGRGGGILLTLILLLMAAGTAAVAYWSLEMKKTLDSQQAELTVMRERLAEMSEALALTSDTASQAGQTLMGRISKLENNATDKYAHFDSEIAKLWTVAYQRNKPQLEEQQKALEAQGEALDALKQSLASAEKKLSALEGTQGQLASLKKSLGSLESSLKEQKARIESVNSDANFALSLEKDERVAAQQALEKRLNQVQQSAQAESDLKRRIASIEQSIQAIDGSRRQFNQSLLRLRDQLNQLQLRVEGG